MHKSQKRLQNIKCTWQLLKLITPQTDTRALEFSIVAAGKYNLVESLIV